MKQNDVISCHDQEHEKIGRYEISYLKWPEFDTRMNIGCDNETCTGYLRDAAQAVEGERYYFPVDSNARTRMKYFARKVM
jgi:hypothetical protein